MSDTADLLRDLFSQLPSGGDQASLYHDLSPGLVDLPSLLATKPGSFVGSADSSLSRERSGSDGGHRPAAGSTAASSPTSSKGGKSGGHQHRHSGDDRNEQDEQGATAGGGGSGSGSGDGKKAKKTRNRKPSSCAQCRKKKLRCNRADPCDQCVAKGQGHLCSWEGAEPLYRRRDETDTQELRDQVARLESLVRYLTQQRRDEEAVEPLPSNAESPSSPNVVSFPSKHKSARQGSSSSQTHPQTPKNSYAMDLRANDLCEGIAQLAIKEFVVVEGSGNDSWAPGNTRGLEFIDEAKLFLSTMPQQFGVAGGPAFAVPPRLAVVARSRAGSDANGSGPPSPTSSVFSLSGASALSPSPLGTASFGREAPPLSEALKFLPTHKQALSAYTYFCGYVSWYAHPVHLATFEQQWHALEAALKLEDEEQRNRAIDPFFIATFLGVCATGLSMMPVKRAIRDGFSEDKDRMVDHWLEGAMVALTCGRFLDNPSVEAVRATVVLSTFFVFVSTGERSGAGMGLLSLVVQIALSLGLHRDPDRSPGRFTFFEAEERRRLFWNLFMLCILSSASLSRTWAVFDLNGVDTKLPLDCNDHEILEEKTAYAAVERRKTKFEETPMTSLIVKMKLAVLARKMNDRAFGIHPVPYEEVLSLDAELREFEESIPARYQLRLDPSGALIRPAAHITVTEMRACMIQISLAGEYIRLHRPWLLLSGQNKTFQYSRDQAIKYSKLLLAIYRSPSCNKQKWGGLSYKATNAAIVLAVEILSFPDGSEVSSLRTVVKAVQKQLEAQASFSSLCRKGSRLIGFLLDKDAALSAQRDQHRHQKRARVDDADIAGFPSRSLRSVFDPTLVGHPHPPFLHDRDDESLHHKSEYSPAPTGSFTVPSSHSSSAEAPRQTISLPSQRDLRSHPLPPMPQHRAPLPHVAASTHGVGVNFTELAGTFEFDFNLPSHQPYASPAPTNCTSAYGSPYPVIPYQNAPAYAAPMPSHPPTPMYSGLPDLPADSAVYAATNFVKLCPGVDIDEWCLRPPSNGTCCGICPASGISGLGEHISLAFSSLSSS
ncbi:hypothetical protein JCM21900_006579 [Sporobolomyces salmonicolor]